MLNRLFAAAILSSIPGLLAAAPAEPTSMRFEWVTEGPADTCETRCRKWVAASGPITPESIRDFDLFAEVTPLQGATMVLESGGGSVIASLELGRKVRQLGMTTTVGRAIYVKAGPGEPPRVKLSPRAECASMCVFVLLGGAQRIIPPESRVLVHQIWPGSKRSDPSAENYTADEMVRIQRDVGRIARYTVEMGGDIELFELAMRIPPWERLRSLTAAELRRTRLHTLEAVAEIPTSGVAVGPRTMPQIAARAERGWALADRGARQALSRQHVLTIEGEEIGRFQLALQCGSSPTSYRMSYRENRTLDPTAHDARINDVNIWIDGERSPLEINSSKPQQTMGELETFAGGEVTAAFLNKLRQEPNGVIVVSTSTTDNIRTTIRVGTSGFLNHFQRLAADCSQSAQKPDQVKISASAGAN